MKHILATLVLLSTTDVFAQPVREVWAEPLTFPQSSDGSQATHELSIHVHTFEGTRWSMQEISPAMAEAATLLVQCRIALTGVFHRRLSTPRRFHFYSTDVSRELLRGFEVSRPAIFFVEDTLNRPAFDAETIGFSNAKGRPELAGSIWVAHGARDLRLALAHELAHLLSDSGEHSREPGNLMQPDTAPENVHLNAAQCERMRERGEANGLLMRRVVKP